VGGARGIRCQGEQAPCYRDIGGGASLVLKWQGVPSFGDDDMHQVRHILGSVHLVSRLGPGLPMPVLENVKGAFKYIK
jgi:hypothetical protein